MPVYFLQPGDEPFVKIGHADDVAARVRDLQAGNHLPLQVIRELPGGQPEEAWLHRRFREHRVLREWFGLVPEMLSVVVPFCEPLPPISDSSMISIIIFRFGGVRQMALACGLAPMTVSGWRRTGRLPVNRVDDVAAGAIAQAIAVSDAELAAAVLGRPVEAAA